MSLFEFVGYECGLYVCFNGRNILVYYSYDEMAKHDLPAMLEHVLVETGVEKVVYVGHSMGTTVFFATMSSLPEYYQDRIAAMVALAPVATIKSISSPIKYLAPLVNELHVSDHRVKVKRKCRVEIIHKCTVATLSNCQMRCFHDRHAYFKPLIYFLIMLFLYGLLI